MPVHAVSTIAKSLLVGVGASLFVYVISVIWIYRDLEAGRPSAENLHPAHLTGIPASGSFFFALVYAVPAFLVVTLVAALVLYATNSYRRRREVT
jgi:ABC-type uncharacterized transport system permease subunit